MGSGPKEQKTTEVTDTSGKTSSSTTGTTKGTVTGATAQGVQLPEYLQSLIQGLPGIAGTQMQDLGTDVSQFQVDPAAMSAVRDTAAGNYLFGGPGFDAAVTAATNRAIPTINSQFGMAGRGGSGLYANSLGQSAIDAVASQYGNERQLQMQAAQMLPQFQQLPLNLKNMLLQNTLSVPQAFQSLYGQTGTSTGTTKGKTSQQTRGTTSGSGTSVQTQPLYQPGPFDYALTGLGLLGSFV